MEDAQCAKSNEKINFPTFFLDCQVEAPQGWPHHTPPQIPWPTIGQQPSLNHCNDTTPSGNMTL